MNENLKMLMCKKFNYARAKNKSKLRTQTQQNHIHIHAHFWLPTLCREVRWKNRENLNLYATEGI